MRDEQTLTTAEVKRAIPNLPSKADLAFIDGDLWKLGPDGLWYRLDDADGE